MDPSTNPGIQPFGAADLDAVKATDAQRGIAAPAPPKSWDGSVAGTGLTQDGQLLSEYDPYRIRINEDANAGTATGTVQVLIENGGVLRIATIGTIKQAIVP